MLSDVASAEQQKAAGPLKDQDEDENYDVAMETEDQEEQLQSADVEELKPEQLETSKFSQKGFRFLLMNIELGSGTDSGPVLV